MYTNHYELIGKPETKNETQYVIFSQDGIRFGNNTLAIVNNLKESTNDFRDPKIWFEKSEKAYFCTIGNNYQKLPSILLYKSFDIK